MPSAFATSLPSIYQPWDLQHVHFPAYFTYRTRVAREVHYRAFCEQATAVVVTSESVRKDLIKQYTLPGSKVAVIPAAPATISYSPPSADALQKTQTRLGLPERFAFYPARTWEHKNHLCLLKAIAALRDRKGIMVPVICSGRPTEFFSEIQARTNRLGLSEQVRFLDFVDDDTLQCLYGLCSFVVLPTKFEGWGMPLGEALLAGKAVACSDIPPFREQANGVAIMFDPGSIDQIGAAIERIWSNSELRGELEERGRQRVTRFSWDRTARILRALYRRVGGARLTDEDRELLTQHDSPTPPPNGF